MLGKDDILAQTKETLEDMDVPTVKRGRPRKEDIKPKKDSPYDEKKREENIKKDVISNKIIDELVDLGLNSKQQDFVLYYLESSNATQSYLKAFGGEKKWATISGYRTLNIPKIKSAIKKMKQILSVGLEIDPTKYIETQLKIANADIGDYIKFSEEEIPMYNEDGTIMFDPDTGEQQFKKVNRMHLVDSNTVDTSVITSIKNGRDGISIQLMDKMKAWENIKNFFEWKVKKEEKEAQNNNILIALGESAKNSWNMDDVNADLKETLKEDA